jgi:hypothetical protein
MKSKIIFESTTIQNSQKIMNNLSDKNSRMKSRDYTLATISEIYNYEAYEKYSQHLRNDQI